MCKCVWTHTFAQWYNVFYNLSTMKVFFTCSTRNINKYAKKYRFIRDEIIRLGHQINRDWIDYSINVKERNIPDIASHTVYKDVMSAILTADVVVVDSTVRSMSVGHQVTYAMQKSKPVLLLKKFSNDKRHKKLFIEGSESRGLNTAEYKKTSDIKKILENFFKKYEDKSTRRFNLVLTGSQDSYVSWASYHYKKTKTDVIQEAIDKMAEKDIAFKRYLSRQS